MAIDRNAKLEEKYQQILFMNNSNMLGFDCNNPVAAALVRKANMMVFWMAMPFTVIFGFAAVISIVSGSIPIYSILFGASIGYFAWWNKRNADYFSARIKEDQEAGIFKKDGASPTKESIVKCPSCGEAIKAEASVCQHCRREVPVASGLKAASPPSETNMAAPSQHSGKLKSFCSGCGGTLAADAAFCENCGRKVKAPD